MGKDFVYMHVFGFLPKGIMKYTKERSTRVSVMFQALKKNCLSDDGKTYSIKAVTKYGQNMEKQS